MIYQIIIPSPIGFLTISEEKEKIIRIDFGKNKICGIIRETELLRSCRAQLEDYFAGRLKSFSLPLSPEGTEFQIKVWNALTRIPYGHTASYGDIAKAVGCVSGARAVGGANHRNPIPIIIPCHRVINSDGSIGGYAGGTDIKNKLLEIEKKGELNGS